MPRILFVDGLSDDREIYGDGLALLGFGVTLLTPTEIDTQSERPDAIVLHLQGTEGWATCDRLGRLYPAVPVLLITAAVRPDGANRRRAQETANCAAFIGKPCTHLELASVIERVLAGERGIQLTTGRA